MDERKLEKLVSKGVEFAATEIIDFVDLSVEVIKRARQEFSRKLYPFVFDRRNEKLED